MAVTVPWIPAHAPARWARQQGVSLLEALVALTCLSFAVLGLAHAQAGLLLEAEEARVRAQAARLAQSAMEEARTFTTVQAAGTVRSYADVVSADLSATLPPSAEVTFDLRREVLDLPGLALKAVRVRVSWRNRHGVERRLELDTLLAGAAPGAPAYVPSRVPTPTLAHPQDSTPAAPAPPQPAAPAPG